MIRRNEILKLVLLWLSLFSFFEVHAQDSTLFIGRVWYLQNTDEFYTNLTFKKNFDDSAAKEEILPQLDSVITKEYYLTRKCLPNELADKYFDLEKYKQISIYNQSHELVTRARFKRVEYYEDMIDGMFIAVFDFDEIDDVYKTELIFYAVSSELSPKLVEKFRHEEITKNQLDKNIIKYLKYDKDNLLKSKHFELKQSSLDKISILSLEDLDSFTYSTYLLEHDGSKVKILKQLNGDYVFWDLLPVPYLVNEKPIFIVEIIIPESDYTGYMLAIFDGQEYYLQTNMEIKV